MIRKVLGVATAALVLSLGAGHLDAHAKVDCVIKIDKVRDYQVYSYQALSPSGSDIDESYVEFSNSTNGNGYPKLDVNATMIVSFKNATLKNPGSIALFGTYEDGNSTTKVVVKPVEASADKVSFKFIEGHVFSSENGTQIHLTNNGTFTVEKLTELKDNGYEEGNNLWLHIPGDLKIGDKAEIIITAVKENGEHYKNGCVRKEFLVIDTEYVAAKPGIDMERLAIVADEDKAGILMLYDDDNKGAEAPQDHVLYDPCDTYHCVKSALGSDVSLPPHSDTTAVCYSNPVTGGCTLFCNESSGGSSGSGGSGGSGGSSGSGGVSCAIPDFCDEFACWKNEPGALRIFRNPNMEERSVLPPTPLTDTTVTLTLKGDMIGVSKVEFLAPVYNADGSVSSYESLCTATPENGVASCQVSGNTLFQEKHRNPGTGSIDVTFKVYVDGETQLVPESFAASAEISGGQFYHPADLDWSTVMTWGEGLKSPAYFKVPYMRTDSLMTSAIRIENTSKDETPLALYVSDPNGGWKFVKAVLIPAGQEVIIKGSQLVDWAKKVGLDLKADKSGRFSVVGITTLAPCDYELTRFGWKDADHREPVGTKALENAIEQFKNLSIYVSQQVIGTSNVRFVPVELIPGTPADLHL